METIKRKFSELSVLFPVTTLYTLVYIGVMIANFATKVGFTIHPWFKPAYLAVLAAYAGDKEVRRWMGKAEAPRFGSVLFTSGSSS